MFLIRIRIRVHPGSRSAATLPLDPVRNNFAPGSGFATTLPPVDPAMLRIYFNPPPPPHQPGSAFILSLNPDPHTFFLLQNLDPGIDNCQNVKIALKSSQYLHFRKKHLIFERQFLISIEECDSNTFHF